MAAVTIENVQKTYGKTKIIRGVSVDVPDGAFVVLVGPSGCGKSTLLRMIAGLEDIDGGTIRIDGRIINSVEPKHRDIAMVFQNYALYPHFTIAQNMGFSLRLAGRPKDEIARSVNEAARILGLTDYLDRYPRQLSGGQRQRVAMGRAIVRNPKVFLFDEPLSNLDAKLRVQMRAELKDIHARLTTTTVYVTHDQIEAMTMADRIVVMRDGIVEQVGEPLELFDRPANLFVASFIGSPAMNFLSGKIASDGGAPYFLTGNGTRLPLDPSAAARAGTGPVTYGIRPEHLAIAPEGEGFPAEIAVLEPTGSETHIVARLGSDQLIALLRQRIAARPGEILHFQAQPGTSHLFDSETGLRIN